MDAQRYQAESEIDPDAARIRQRLRALRSRYPGLILATELTHIHDDQVVIRATITLTDGSAVSAYAAEPSDSTGLLDSAIELAEQRATVRALDLMGVGDVTAQSRRSESPSRRDETPPNSDLSPPPVVDALRKASQRRASVPEQVETVEEASPSPAVESLRRTSQRRPLTAEQIESVEAVAEVAEVGLIDDEPDQPNQVEAVNEAADADDEPDMADYTWTHFWTWARARANELSTKGQVEQRIGRPIDGLTPREVRQMLHETGVPL